MLTRKTFLDTMLTVNTCRPEKDQPGSCGDCMYKEKIMSQEQKIALITGANKGIGFEIARQLGQLGNVVLVGARNRTLGEKAAGVLEGEGITATAIELDVTDQQTIDRAAATIEEMYGKLDILINNAGISLREAGTPPSVLEIAALRQTFETNFFGAFAVTKAMLPLLRKSQAGRIVNQSSQMGSLSLQSDPESFYATMPPMLAYNSSKTALNALTVLLARELRETPIKVNSVSPGYCATDLNGHSGFMTAAQGARIAVKFATIDADGPNGGFYEGEEAVAW
jgi:NAD(P)-dependent dehydrogenase (short-subunit alcohol dehydrogenase family)